MNHTKQSKKRPLLLILCGVFLLFFCGMLFALLYTPEQQTPAFIPPDFESAADLGVPTVPEELGYSSLYKDGMSYRFSVCGNVKNEGGNAVVYLTNPTENEVWLKVRILDEQNRVLGESGLLKPGEYVRSVHLAHVPSAGTPIKLKIMGYIPETYHSAGAVVLNTVMGDEMPS